MNILLQTFKSKPIKKPDLTKVHYVRRYSIIITEHKAFAVVVLLAMILDTIVLGWHYFMIPEQEETYT